MILTVMAATTALLPDPETRKEIPIPDGSDTDVVLVAEIRSGRVALKYHYQVGLGLPALRPDPPAHLRDIMTVADIDQIIEAIENFVMGPVEDAELDAIWQPYIDKLKALRGTVERSA